MKSSFNISESEEMLSALYLAPNKNRDFDWIRLSPHHFQEREDTTNDDKNLIIEVW